MAKTKIEWATDSWNPVSGCTPVSEGCLNCYAARMAKRLPQTHGGWEEGEGGDTKPTPVPFSQVVCHPDRLDQPLHWRRPRVVFVSSMGDLFHEDVPGEFIRRVFWTMREASRHTFLLLTKRAKRMADFVYSRVGEIWQDEWPFPNVYLGVSVENQDRADERIPILLDTPAAHRFVSVEPALGFGDWGLRSGTYFRPQHIDDRTPRPYLEWMIWGCESGARRRSAPPHWAYDALRACQRYGIPFFLKQMSANEDGTGKVVKMPKLDGRVWAQTLWDKT